MNSVEREAFLAGMLANMLILTSVATLVSGGLAITAIALSLKAAEASSEVGFHNAGVLGSVAGIMAALGMLGAVGVALTLQAVNAHRHANRPRAVLTSADKRGARARGADQEDGDFHEVAPKDRGSAGA